MKRNVKTLMDVCISLDINCTISRQKINDYSIEIYKGYGKDFQQLFYTDGHVSLKKAIKKALICLDEYSNW